MKELFSIGPITINFFGFMIAVGILVAYCLIQKTAKDRLLDPDKVTSVGLVALLGGIIGARLAYALVYAPDYYLMNPIQLLSVHQGGLSIHGGIAGGLFAGWLAVRKYRFSVWMLADLFAPPLLLAQAIGRIGCDVFGKAVTSSIPWAIQFQGSLVHPAQMYEFLLNLSLFWWLWQRRKAQLVQGQIFFYYAIGFLLIRGFVEFFRTNPVVFGFLSVSHLLTILGLMAALAVMVLIPRPKYDCVTKQGFSLGTAILLGLTAAGGLLLYYFIH